MSKTVSAASITNWIKQRTVLANCIVLCGYVLFALLGYAMVHAEHKVSPIWPPMGWLLVVVYFGQRRLLAGLFLGVVATQIIGDKSILTSLMIGVGAILAALLTEYLLHYVNRYRSVLEQATLPLWIALSGLCASLVTATIGTCSLLYVQKLVLSQSFSDIWLIWWIGDALGAMIIAPLILFVRPIPLRAEWWLRVILLLIIAILTLVLIFFQGIGAPLLFLVFPLLLLAYYWFGAAGGAWMCLAFVMTAVYVASEQSLNGFDYADQIVLFDSFLVALVLTSLAVSAYLRRENFLLPAILFLVGWFISGWLFYSLKTTSTALDEIRLAELIEEAHESVGHRLNVYVDALRAAASFRINSNHVSREEWANYVAYLEMDRRYPGINGLGFIFPFTDETVDAYVDWVRANEFPDFEIKEVPNVPRPPADNMGFTHYLITHIEPISINRQAVGLDTASEANRQRAGQSSRDLGVPAMTDRIVLVQDGKARPGFLIYFPMYERGMPTSTVEERRVAFVGWSYAPFITEHFLQGVLGQRVDQIEFSVFDSQMIRSSSFVYSTRPESEPLQEFEVATQLNLAGQVFSFGWSRGPRFPKQDTTSVTVAAASLALGTCFLVGVIVILQDTNRRANQIVQLKTEELLDANEHLQLEAVERSRAEQAARVARKNAEEARKIAEEANLAKSEFLATMSHEIRTPMNSVLGFAELLAGTELDATQRQWTNYIGAAGNTLLRIINDILDFSKIEAGKLVLENIPFSMGQTIDEVVGSFSVLAAEKGIEIDSEIDPNLPDTVLGDPVRLMQIINNLNSNALKFTESGHIQTRVEWAGDQNSGVVTIQVVDTGIGISPEKVSRLFEKFTQADSSTTRRFGGTGLGLAICKSLVELKGGEIYAESTVDVGTTVTVKMPFEVAKVAVIADLDSNNSAVVESRPYHPIDVLLVDDNSVNRMLGVAILEQFGCRVSVATNGVEALQMIQDAWYPIIFMDCQMPQMDGFTATSEIRKLENRGALTGMPKDVLSVSIIALTANASPEDKARCLRAGMDDYLMKPCKFDDFQRVLEIYGRST